MIKTKLHFTLKNTSNAQAFELNKTSYSIGREEGCDILLKDGHPSRMHAQIIFKEGHLLVDDLDSKNGTFVNNNRITHATRIKPGDRIKFSTNEFILLSDTPEDKTIISKNSPPSYTSNSFIVVEENELDPEETTLQQDYPLPAGWKEEDRLSKTFLPATSEEKKSDSIFNEIIKQALVNEDTLYFGALIVNPSDAKPQVIGLSIDHQQQTLSIGRSKECTFTIDSPSMSEHHANLSFKNGKWYISDNKSTNGIRVNKELVSHTLLKHGTTMTLGKVKLLYRDIPWSI